MSDQWLKQEFDKPLFPDLIWSRPETKHGAGKLLIIGGNKFGFAAPAEAYSYAQKAGAGSIRVLLPNSIQKIVGGVFPDADFGSSTPSGSFAKSALSEFLAAGEWSDGILLAGDLGRNSETAVLLETFAGKYAGPLILTKDAADYFKDTPQLLFERTDTILVISIAQLQKFVRSLAWKKAIKFEMALLQLVEVLQELSGHYSCGIVVKHCGQIFVAYDGRVSTTKLETDKDIWRLDTAVHASVWVIQNPTKIFEAMTTSVLDKI